MDEQQGQKMPTSITARFSINLEDASDPIIAARIKVDGQEAKLPVFMVLGGLVVTEALVEPSVRAAYAQILFKASQDLALGLLREATATKEGSDELPAPPNGAAVKSDLTEQ